MTRERKLAKNILILAFGTFLPRLATFIILPVLTGGLTKEEYGTYDLMLVLVLLLLPAVTLQIHTAAFRFLLEYKDDKKECKRIVTNIYTLIVCASIVALLFLYIFLHQIDNRIKILICAYLFLDILTVSSQWVVRGFQLNHKYSVGAILNSLGQIIFSVVFVWWMKIGLAGAILSLICSNTITLAYLMVSGGIYRYFDISLLSIDSTKKMLSYSWPLVPNNMSMWVMRVSDRLVVTYFMGIAANAIYAVANKIPQILNVAQSTFTMAWQESAAITSKDKDVNVYYSFMFQNIFNLTAGLLGLIIAFTPILFKVLIRGSYEEAYMQIPVLLLAMFFSTLTSYLGGIYVAFKETKSIGLTTVGASICNLIVDLALIKYIGLYAASGSTLISYIFLFLFRSIDIKKVVNITYNFKKCILIIAVMLIECVIFYVNTIPSNIFNVIFCLFVFLVLNRRLVHKIFSLLKQKVLNTFFIR